VKLSDVELAVAFADKMTPEEVTDEIVVPDGMPVPDTAMPTTSPLMGLIETVALPLVAVNPVEIVLSEIAAAAALGMPVTPAGSEVVGLFSPKHLARVVNQPV
jgi:hypothetical protein